MIEVVIKFANNDEYSHKCTIEQGQKALADWYSGEPHITLGNKTIYCKDEKRREWIKEIIFVNKVAE